MKRNLQQHMGLLMVIALWLCLTLWAWLKPADAVSVSERRSLAQMPQLSSQSLLSGNFMEDFASYAVDQFPLRDGFRQIKALAANYGFGQRDNNGIYLAGGSAVAMEYPLDSDSVDYALERFNELYDLYLNESSNILFAIVPDKGYYLGKSSAHLTMDYEALFSAMQTGLSWARFVDITDCLTGDSYYRTDTHWRQEHLLPVAEKLARALDIPAPEPDQFDRQVLTQDFRGVYHGQAALPMEPDTLLYLTWQGWEDCTVYTHDTAQTTQIYDMGKRASNDLYDIFLSGGAAVQTIQNPNAATDRELIVFRDSFGSSLIPLLAQEYSTVTLIDTRYISPKLLEDYVNFQDKEILMLYSTLLLNSSGSLRK